MKDYKNVLNKLDMEQKLQLTHGNSNWTFFGVEKLGYPELMCGDGPHGLRAYSSNPKNGLFDPNSYSPTTLFPVAAAMAATFHPELIQQVGQAIGEECNMHFVDLLLAPGLNLKRSPLGGRNFEYYSEDPYLTGVFGSAFVKGVQSTGVGACIKHFALNEQEHQRRFIDTTVDDFTLHEHYLRPFHYAIKEANPWALMTSYNRVRGDYAGESKLLLQDILRDTWNYDGLVLSDWGGVQHKIKSVKYGMNLEMPGPSEFHDAQVQAMEQGELSETEVDQSLIPLFGFYDRVKDNPNRGKQADFVMHHQLAQQVAREAIVLLENDGILPLQSDQTVAVIGQYASHPRINGGGSAALKPQIIESPLDELSNQFQTMFATGYQDGETSKEMLEEAETVVNQSDVVLFFTGTESDDEGEDRSNINLPTSHLQVLQTIIQTGKPLVVILNSGSAVDVSPFVDQVNGLVQAWLLGGANAVALVDILRGTVNPSGRLTETFPMNLKQTPHYGAFPGRRDVVHYEDDVIKNGYRYYELHDLTPRYPFGYGLSYTTFEYNSIALDAPTIYDDEALTLSISLTNTGDYQGQETIQVYISKPNSRFLRPVKELKSFRKLNLKPAETKTVSLVLEPDQFAIYHSKHNAYLVEEGDYQIMVGSNVSDPSLMTTVTIKNRTKIHHGLTMEHPLKLFKERGTGIVEDLEKQVGTIPWHHMEEPAVRVLRRFLRRNTLTKEEHQAWVEKLLE